MRTPPHVAQDTRPGIRSPENPSSQASGPVWLHWAGLWILTPDGLSPVLHRAERILLREVRFVIDPVGLELTRERGKRKTHAWAVGEHVRWDSELDEREPMVWGRLRWQSLIYRPRRGDDHFQIEDDGPRDQDGTRRRWWLEGADYLDADHEGGVGVARIAGPRFGDTERRRVQQYGGRR